MVRSLFHTKFALTKTDIIEIKILEVPKSNDFQEGVRYSLVYIHDNKRVLGYDNERGKGHHKHYKNKEVEIKFKDPETLISDFIYDVKKIFNELYKK